MKLKNKVAIITGGGAGIGKALALGMAREGVDIVITDIVVGYTFYEDLIVENGKTLNPCFLDYKLPTALEMSGQRVLLWS